MPPISLLVISASPDERPSTLTLQDAVEELRSHPGIEVSVWFLRESGGVPWAGSRVVDELRTNEPAATFDRFGLTPAANLVRGGKLRRWLADVDPDVVFLDDGLGERVLGRFVRNPPTVVRLNSLPPTDLRFEPPAATKADLVLTGSDDDRRGVAARSALRMPLLRRHPEAKASVFADKRAAVRQRIGVPVGPPLVVGWGDDAWLDGPDLLVRTLWYLEDRHGVSAHGLWLGADSEAAHYFDDEAERCGLSDRAHRHDTSSPETRTCGDAVLLPYRSVGSEEALREALVAGMEVVTFPLWDLQDPALTSVPHLDIEAAASALNSAFACDRTRRSALAVERYDVEPWVDRFVSKLQEIR